VFELRWLPKILIQESKLYSPTTRKASKLIGQHFHDKLLAHPPKQVQDSDEPISARFEVRLTPFLSHMLAEDSSLPSTDDTTATTTIRRSIQEGRERSVEPVQRVAKRPRLGESDSQGEYTSHVASLYTRHKLIYVAVMHSQRNTIATEATIVQHPRLSDLRNDMDKGSPLDHPPSVGSHLLPATGIAERQRTRDEGKFYQIHYPRSPKGMSG
jgi:hypothetical protein